MSEPLMVLYAVRNRDGEFFRAKGYGGSGKTWVPELAKAKVYTRAGPARSQVTFFANNYPKFGVPELVALHVTEVQTLNETDRVKKSQTRKAKQEAERAKRQAEWRLEEAKAQIESAEKEIRKILGERT